MSIPSRPATVTLCAALAAAVTLWAPTCLEAGGEGWITDVEAAKKQAAKENKDLLVDFTGSDWCVWCVRLKNEVFDTDAFKKEAPKSFVLVELDFPRDKSIIPEATQKQNQEWMEKLGVEGFPTIYLLDSKGRPYAKTGYRPGGPEDYLKHLAELREVRVKLAESLTAAEKASGVEKAKLLDKALSNLEDNLVLAGYRETATAIIALDADDEAGLKGKYEDLLNLSEVRKAVARARSEFSGENLDAVLASLEETEKNYGKGAKARFELGMFKLRLLMTQEQPDRAEKLIDELLKTEGLEPLQRVDLVMMRIRNLRAAGKSEEIVKEFDGLVGDDSIPDNVRIQLRAQRARALAEVGKVDQALKDLDEVLLKEEDPNMKFRLHITKGELLARAGRKDEASKEFDAAVEAAADEKLKDQIRQYKERILSQDS